MPDEITEELWKIKDNIAREYNYDIRALPAHLQSKKEAKRARAGDQDSGREMLRTDKSHGVGH